MVRSGCETRARWSMRGESSSHDDWKPLGGFAHNFVGRARRQPALSVCLCGFSPGHQPTDKRDRRWIVRHDMLCPSGGFLPAFFVVRHRRKHTANRRLSHQHDVTRQNHVCRGHLARHRRQERSTQQGLVTSHAAYWMYAWFTPGCTRSPGDKRISVTRASPILLVAVSRNATLATSSQGELVW